MNPMNIRLHIERLVLDGIDLSHSDRSQLLAAVESELSRLLGEGGLSSSLEGGIAVPSLPAPGITLDVGRSPVELGHQVAGAVYGGLSR